MAGLKELRTRVESIKSTQKITSAMKLVAAARLRRAQELIAKSIPYHQILLKSASRLVLDIKAMEQRDKVSFIYPKLVRNDGKSHRHIVVVISSNKGLCGVYNTKVAKEAAIHVEDLRKLGKDVYIVCVGKKAYDILKRKYADKITDIKINIVKKGARYDDAADLANKLMERFYADDFDYCDVVYTKFNSAVSTEIVVEQLLPVNFDHLMPIEPLSAENATYESEPHQVEMLTEMLPLLVREELFAEVAQSQASEHGMRMTSMDNATRNAKDIISKLTLRYNRIRQSAITTELVEIIAGAEAI